MSLSTQLKFDSHGRIPAIIRDAETGEVLMLAHMNAEAVNLTVQTGNVHYYSSSLKKVRMKGHHSGQIQTIRELRIDCEAACLLISVEQIGAACHTGHKSCFYQIWDNAGGWIKSQKPGNVAPRPHRQDILDAIYQVIQERRRHPSEKSYVTSLFAKGLDKILAKIGEEATETAVAGKGGNPDEVVYETADLFFHALILLGYYNLPPERIYTELRRRFGISGIEEKENRTR